MRQVWNRLFGGECEHLEALVIESVGIRRSVCERCGHVSFVMLDGVIAHDRPEPETHRELPRAAGL